MTNALEIKNLEKAYDSFKLKSINLTLPAGCVMGLIGENGAGKSTLIKLILGMIRRDRGAVHIIGKDSITEINSIKQDVGVVLDDVGLPECLTAKQIGNIMRLTFDNWDDDVYSNYLKQLDIPANIEFKRFSRGSRMKLGFAVAMSHRPKLLILDVNCRIA